MKKTTIRPMATPHSSFRLSRPDRAIVEKRFTLPVSRPVTLAKSESWGGTSAVTQGGTSTPRPGPGSQQRAELMEACACCRPYHAVQVPVLVLRIPVDVQGQLVGTQRKRGRARATCSRAPDPPGTADPANSSATYTATTRTQAQCRAGRTRWEVQETLPGLCPLWSHRRVPAGGSRGQY